MRLLSAVVTERWIDGELLGFLDGGPEVVPKMGRVERTTTWQEGVCIVLYTCSVLWGGEDFATHT